MKPLETRFMACEVRAEEREEGSIITGRPVVYNSRTNLGWFDEIIAAGALIGTDLRDVRLLVNHDFSSIPLARSRRNNGNSTMTLFVDDEGLGFEALLDTIKNARAKELHSAVLRGDVTGMSFAFSIDGEKWDDIDSDHPTRTITKIASIVEISACTFPAYEATEIFARSDNEAMENAKKALEKAREERAKTLESVKELELLKMKARALY